MRHTVRFEGESAVCGTVRVPYDTEGGVWVVQGDLMGWPTRVAARNAARAECLRRYNPLEDLLIHVLRGQSSLTWVVLHQCAGDHELLPWVRKAERPVKRVLNYMFGDERRFSLTEVDNPLPEDVRDLCRLTLEGGVTLQVQDGQVTGLEFAPKTRDTLHSNDRYEGGWLSDLEGDFMGGPFCKTPTFVGRNAFIPSCAPLPVPEDVVRDALEDLFGPGFLVVTL